MRWCVVTLFVFALGCASGQIKGGGLEPFGDAGITASATSKRYALVIGVQEFQDERFGGLKHTSADARAMASTLREFDEVKLLTRPNDTTRASILAAVRALRDKAKGPGDTLVVYISTHGTLSSAGGRKLSRYLVASDTRLDLPGRTGIGVESLLGELNSSRSRRTALILATCHSGVGKSVVADEFARALESTKGDAVPQLSDVSEATMVLSAASLRESAREDNSLGHDIYTFFLMRGVDEGDRNADGAVTVTEAHDYARERTYLYTEGAQRPSIVTRVLGDDPIVLRGQRQRRGKPLLYSYENSADGVSIAVDGAKKGALPGAVAVETGRHRVRLADRNDRTLWSGRVRVDAGERVNLADLIRKRRRIAVEAGAVTSLPMGSDIRDRFMPSSFGVGGRISASHFGWKSSYFEASFGREWGGGSAPAFDRRESYDFTRTDVRLGGGAEFMLGERWTVATGLLLGQSWARRQFDSATFDADQRFRGTYIGTFAAGHVRFLRYMLVGARADAGLLRAPLGGDVRQPMFVGASMMVGGTF